MAIVEEVARSITCPRCGASVAPTRGETAWCEYCRAAIAVPRELNEAIEGVASRRDRAERRGRTAGRLRDRAARQFGWAGAMSLLAVLGPGVLLPEGLSVWLGGAANFAKEAPWLVLSFLCMGAAVACLVLAGRYVYPAERALFVEALPPEQPGGPQRCPRCGGEVPFGAAPFAECPFCRATCVASGAEVRQLEAAADERARAPADEASQEVRASRETLAEPWAEGYRWLLIANAGLGLIFWIDVLQHL